MPDLIPPDLQRALDQRYELRRVLGRGGMATVYLAYDRKHHRDVALKVLLPELAAFLGVGRFLREIEIAARLTHPHILALYESGEAGGFLYYVMPFVEGGSLRDRLIAEGPFHLSQAMAIVRPVADALTYAHRLGVLHRDIKPENILFSQGHPVLGDFGIARALSTAGSTPLTRTGFPVGTPGYMSPEQAAGITDLDATTDVYSLAVVAFEMLLGELPGRWPTEEAVRVGRFLDAPERLRSGLDRVGPQVEAALVRGLAIRQDQRTQTPGDLLADLASEAGVRPRFSPLQAEQIVHRAAELEATRPTQSGSMTMGGVEALAAEVGISPTLVREAAASLSAQSSGDGGVVGEAPRNRWLDGPTRIVFERVIEGELPLQEFTTLVDEIRSVLRMGGQVSQLGHSFSWSPARQHASRRDLEVVVSVRGGTTRITVHENLSQLAAAVFGGIGGGMGGGGMGPVIGITVGALNTPLALFGVLPVWFAATFLTARTVYRNTSRKRVQELERLVQQLERTTRALIRPRVSRVGSG